MLVKASVVIATVVTLSGCQTIPEKFTRKAVVNVKAPLARKQIVTSFSNPGLEAFLQDAEIRAEPLGRAVLRIGRKMVLHEKALVRGSCWDYANAIYNRAGFVNSKTDRHIVFKGSSKGPYAKPELIKPGDFLSHINHAYHGGVHSAIFVGWKDFERQQALMLSYAGKRKTQPARYKIYDLSSVYQIVRPNDTTS